MSSARMAEAVRALYRRKRGKVTKKAAAEILGISAPTVSKYWPVEKEEAVVDERKPGGHEWWAIIVGAKKIAALLNVSVATLNRYRQDDPEFPSWNERGRVCVHAGELWQWRMKQKQKSREGKIGRPKKV